MNLGVDPSAIVNVTVVDGMAVAGWTSKVTVAQDYGKVGTATEEHPPFVYDASQATSPAF